MSTRVVFDRNLFANLLQKDYFIGKRKFEYFYSKYAFINMLAEFRVADFLTTLIKLCR